MFGFHRLSQPQHFVQHFSDLSRNLQSLLMDGKLTDACLIVGKYEKELHVHKNILSARSPVFAAMFEHDCEEKRQNRVVISDIDQEAFELMLYYIYTGKVKGLYRYGMDLLVAADKYQLLSLKSMCAEYVCTHLSPETVVNVLILADLHQVTPLKAKCIDYIFVNVDIVKATDGWNVLGTNAKLLQELFLYSVKKK